MRSSIALTSGARQLVVHEALEITVSASFSALWLTPKTTVRSTSFSPGAEMITLRAPACRCAPAFALLVKRPVHSSTTSTPSWLPRQLGRVALGHDLDAVAVDHDAVAVDAHVRRERAVRGVVLEQVGVGLRVAEVVDRDELKLVLLAALVVGAQDHAADAAESVDGYFDHLNDAPDDLDDVVRGEAEVLEQVAGRGRFAVAVDADHGALGARRTCANNR